MQEILREPVPVEMRTAERLKALRLTQPPTQEQVDRIRAEHPFEPFCGEIK
jgi:hypothetical protein